MLYRTNTTVDQPWAGPLTAEQGNQLRAFADALSTEQAIWVSGFLAGYHSRTGAVPSAAEAPSEQARTTILFASETGNAASLARQFERKAKERGLAVRLVDAADYRAKELKDEKRLVVIASTQGEGEPPRGSADLVEFLLGRKAPKLGAMRFAVLALGDSTYEHFCRTGRDIDRRLKELGAQPLTDRVDCDIDYEEPAEAFFATLLDRLAEEAPAPALTRVGVPLAIPSATASVVYDRSKPFAAPVIENLGVTGRGSSKGIRHVELSLEGSGLTYEPGDSLGIVPENDPVLVEELVAALSLDGSAALDASSRVTLAEALARRYEITTLTSKFMTGYAELTGSKELKELVGDAARLKAWMAGRQIIDVVGTYPLAGLAVSDLTGLLRKLPPRLYSLASSQKASPDEAHLVVSVVRYDAHGRARAGVASSMLAERAAPDTVLPVYVNENRHFRLPKNADAPIIMIGAGTGVAPYRAFMQEREELGVKAKSWLFFGERTFRSDFLYQVEWQRWLKQGTLDRIDLAFSRDHAEKIYVQHRLLERGKEVHAWLEEGAHLYLCGDAEQMAPDVEAALRTIVARHGSLKEDGAREYLKGLERQGRYQRDVY